MYRFEEIENEAQLKSPAPQTGGKPRPKQPTGLYPDAHTHLHFLKLIKTTTKRTPSLPPLSPSRHPPPPLQPSPAPSPSSVTSLCRHLDDFFSTSSSIHRHNAATHAHFQLPDEVKFWC
ncbi:hypothetical protein Pfo_011112 [Paulownia fortunei]|nr:hypothetical protein Pfo_011112 [Paulownia fortunei]